MEQRKIRIIFRRGSLALKLAVIALILLSMAALLTVWIYKEQAKREYEDLREQAIGLEQENNRLKDAIDKLGTVQGIIQIAGEQLGLVDPDTLIIEPAE